MAQKYDVGEISNVPAHLEWKINLVDEVKSTAKGGKICSPEFTSFNSKDKKNSWHLSLYPNGARKSLDGYMAAYLNNNNDDDVIVTYTLSLLTGNSETIRTRRFENIKLAAKSGHGISNFILKSIVLNPINNLIIDNKITILCGLIENSSGYKKNNQIYKHSFSCQAIIEKIFKNKKYSDVTVVSATDKGEFFLHKCILAAQSSVFEAMFDTDMLGKKENLVIIYDFNSMVLNQFFKYLYTSNFDKTQYALNILILAERYNVEKLKDHCEVIVSLDVAIYNAIEYLDIADVNNAKKLRSNVIRFMATNLEKLQERPEFQSLTAEQLREIIECQFKLSKE